MINETFKATLRGISPLIMHNGLLADHENAFAIELSKVSKGKAKDYTKAAEIEWLGSLYTDAKGEPCIPVDVILAVVIEGAKAYKLGKSAKAGVYDVPGTESFRLDYPGTRDVNKLKLLPEFRDRRGVRVQQSRIIRSRPIFRKWSVSIELEFDPSMISREQISDSLIRAGKAIGIGDFRPRYGRFILEEFK